MSEKISSVNLFFQLQRKPYLPSLQGHSVDYAQDLIFVLDAVCRTVLYMNRKMADFCGHAGVSDAESRPASLIHPQDLARVTKLLSASGKPGRHTCSARLRGRDGVYRFCHLDVNSLQGGDVLVRAHDITDVLKSKDEIETTRELLDETEELLQFGSLMLDISTDVVTWTPGLYALLDYDRGQAGDRISLDFYLSHVLEEYNRAFTDLIRNSLKEKTDFSYEYVVKTHTGALKNVSTRGKLVKDDAGNVVKMLCINRDITALRTFEKEQERNIRELNRSNRELEEFAYIASHDLQEPLRKISMFTERLKAKFGNELDKEGELFIERILASSGNMRALIDNLLNFSRANRRSQNFDQVSVQAVLDGVMSELELKIEETKAAIVCSGNFPVVEAVTSEMAQLFSNILSNAIKFRRKDVAPEIQVKAGRLSKMERHLLGLPAGQTFFKIEVQDNGIGFEPEYAEKIFQIFQRLNGKAEYPGSGIGLAICKKIVEKHNGLIFARSAPDQGATFTIILPEKQF